MVNGDTCKIAASIAVDSTSIACAPIKIGDQGTVGASSVILPGTTVGAQATLAPLAAPAVGSTVEPLTINIGAPSAAVKVCRDLVLPQLASPYHFFDGSQLIAEPYITSLQYLTCK